VIQTLFIGPIVDTFGRKFPLILGQCVAGTAFLMAPQFSSITMFVIVRIFQNLGRAVTINIPLIPDYVDPQYAGAANSLVNVTITTALLVSTSGMY